MTTAQPSPIVLDELIDRALRKGATYTVRDVKGERVLGMYDDIPRTHAPTPQITDELEASVGASWPSCYGRILKRAVAAGGMLSASTIGRAEA
jgi:hypothetical protein